jgi:hypothetical protein
MNKSHLYGAVCACIFSLISIPSHAELIDNGGGLIYDTVLDITWAQNRNPTILSWEDANTYASELTLGGATDWRLPYISVNIGDGFTDGRAPYDCGGGTEEGCRDNELGYMFYQYLGGTSGEAIPPNGDPDVLNLFPNTLTIADRYWSATQDRTNPDDRAWSFDFNGGSNLSTTKTSAHFAWAVHDGNVGLPTGPVDLTGTVQNEGGTPLCALVLASGQFMFSCNPNGPYSLLDLPRATDGTVKRQIYVDGFFPNVETLTDSTDETVVMTKANNCPDYNSFPEPGVFPDSDGKQINVSGTILRQNTQTPLCAMALANGQFGFTCDGSGSYSATIPLDANGQYTLQVYADGFAPMVQAFDEFTPNVTVRMAQAAECQ